MTASSIVAALAALALSHTAGSTGPPPAVTVDGPAPPAVAEYFLVTEESAEGGDGEGAPIAVVAMRSINSPANLSDLSTGASSEGASFLLEREVTFAAGGLRVRHTESGQGAARRLVWREFLPQQSRTWVADWTAGVRGAEARSIGYGWNRPVHERVMASAESDATVYGPLELLYRTRDGSLPCGEAAGPVGVIDPASASIVQVRRTASATGVTAPEVAIDFRRPDDTLLLGATVASQVTSELRFTAVRLSDRRAVVARIGRKEFESLTRRWTVESRRPYDAVLAQIPKRR